MKPEIHQALTDCLTKTVIEFEIKSKKFATCHHKKLILYILPYGFTFQFKRHLNKTQSNVFRNLYSGFVKRLEKVYYELGGESACEFSFINLSTYHAKQCVKVNLPDLTEIAVDHVKYKEYERSLPETDLVATISRRMNHLKKEIINLSKIHPTDSLKLVEELTGETYDVLRYYDFEGDEVNRVEMSMMAFNRDPSLDGPSKEIDIVTTSNGPSESLVEYEVGFFFDDLGLASYHYVHAKSIDEALGKAMVEHISNPNQRKQLITSFTIVENYDELDEFNDVRKNKVNCPDSYEVIFHHIFHIKEGDLACELEECVEESLYTIKEAESEADAVNKALNLHLIDSSDWVINSFDVKKLD